MAPSLMVRKQGFADDTLSSIFYPGKKLGVSSDTGVITTSDKGLTHTLRAT